jgi:Putative Ig domain
MRTLRVNTLTVALALAGAVTGCGGGPSAPSPPSALPPTSPLQPPSVTIATTSLADGAVGFAYSQTIQAQGGTAPFTWSVSAGSLPRGTMLASGSATSMVINGTPDTVENPATFTIQATDAMDQTASQMYSVNIITPGKATMQEVDGQVPAGTIEIQGLSADAFNPAFWQRNALNWVPDVRVPMLMAQTSGTYQNIYSPWPLEQSNGWLLFYGGWDGTDTPNDRVYKTTTPDFFSFGGGQAMTGMTATPGGQLVIDHGAFTHVNNMSVQQLPDGSFHMVCTTLVDANSLDKPTYFSSPDGVMWNGTPEPYEAQLSDVVSIPNDPTYAGYDFNGGNVLLWDANTWVLYYSVGIYGAIGQV